MSENELDATQSTPTGAPGTGPVGEAQPDPGSETSAIPVQAAPADGEDAAGSGADGDTQANPPVETQPSASSPSSSTPARRKFPGWLVALLLVVLVAVGAWGGYNSGISKRYAAEGTRVTGQIKQAFERGVIAMNLGQYEVAKLQFEFILSKNPDYPGVKDMYTRLLMLEQVTPSPTPTLTPTITPTPDIRNVDEIYNDAKALLSAKSDNLCARDWDGIINRIDSLRKADINFHTAEVDGWYYVALRNRGECKIYPQRYMSSASCEDLHINLEGGILDLTMAERFGPLDNDAAALRTWARLYNVGASFWDQDWVQAKSFFRQVMDNVPYLSDSSCVSARERWRQATIGYAKKLIGEGDYCHAEEQLNDLFVVDSPKNEQYFPAATQVNDICNGDLDPPAGFTLP
jgi:hypothetical protein